MLLKEPLVSEETPIPWNPLLKGIFQVQARVIQFKERVREFYFQVIMSQYACPKCGGDLVMTGQSECSCPCGNNFDPTSAFQRSSCCGVPLIRRTFHYACSCCQQIVPSRFLFDERLFDKAYFREMMSQSREQAKKKKEEIRLLLANSRSGALLLTEEPRLEAIPGLNEALADFIGSVSGNGCEYFSALNSDFSMENYRDHILSALGVGAKFFSLIAPLIEDHRRDKIWRFITLIFMAQDREVELTQSGADILVGRVANEAYL